MSDKIDLIAIGELLEKKFYIPSYQRGYRWTKYEVEALLDDINEYDKSKDGDFYSLQPLVVKEANCNVDKKIERRWRIIDGQQRLTTIYLILEFLKHEKILENTNNFDLKYERGTGIDKFSEAVSDKDSIELYYLKENYKNITQWQGWNDSTKLSIKDKILYQTKFIWYDIGEDSDEYKMFRNLNSGKIQLTNAELVKALFLKNVGGTDSDKALKQNLIAEEYDQIERKLREPEFWYFLNGRKNQPSSCINFLFKLMYETDKNLSDTEKHNFEKVRDNKIFCYFERKTSYKGEVRLDSKAQFENVKSTWEDVQKYFHIFEGWYATPEVFNLIGYLRAVGYGMKEIYQTFSDSKDKDDFRTKLKNLCYKQICEDDNVQDNENFDFIKTLRYDNDKYAVVKVLLLANIATLNSAKTDGKDKIQAITKFSFASYHQCNWNVEHIAPNNAIWYDELGNTEFAKKHQDDIVKLKECKKGGSKKLKDINTSDELDAHICVKDESIMTLPNLTLLNEHDNKSVSNKSFKDKRTSILAFQGKGSFVPPCSFMVFTKGYSKDLDKDKLDFWSAEDRENYAKEIINMLNAYFNKGGKSNG